MSSYIFLNYSSLLWLLIHLCLLNKFMFILYMRNILLLYICINIHCPLYLTNNRKKIPQDEADVNFTLILLYFNLDRSSIIIKMNWRERDDHPSFHSIQWDLGNVYTLNEVRHNSLASVYWRLYASSVEQIQRYWILRIYLVWKIKHHFLVIKSLQELSRKMVL